MEMSLGAAWLLLDPKGTSGSLVIKKRTFNAESKSKLERFIFQVQAQGCKYSMVTFTVRSAIEAAHTVRT